MSSLILQAADAELVKRILKKLFEVLLHLDRLLGAAGLEELGGSLRIFRLEED